MPTQTYRPTARLLSIDVRIKSVQQDYSVKSGSGLHPPKQTMHFPLLQIPPLFRIFQSLGKFSRLFPKMNISSAKISDDFLVIRSEFVILPLFSQKNVNFPLFHKLSYFSLFCRIFSLISSNLHVFACFSIPLL